MYKILFLLLALAVLCTAFRLLWLAFPRLKTRSGKVLTAVSFTALFLPLLVPILMSVPSSYTFSVICITGVTAAALIDDREGTTAFELYPVAIGLIASIIIVSDFIGEESTLYQSLSSPVIGLFIGLGTAALAGMIEIAFLPTETLVLGTIEMASVSGFAAGFPGVAWVLGVSIPLCFGVRTYRKRHPWRQNAICDNGCIAYVLVLYLCFHPLLGI